MHEQHNEANTVMDATTNTEAEACHDKRRCGRRDSRGPPDTIRRDSSTQSTLIANPRRCRWLRGDLRKRADSDSNDNRIVAASVKPRRSHRNERIPGGENASVGDVKRIRFVYSMTNVVRLSGAAPTSTMFDPPHTLTGRRAVAPDSKKVWQLEMVDVEMHKVWHPTAPGRLARVRRGRSRWIHRPCQPTSLPPYPPPSAP